MRFLDRVKKHYVISRSVPIPEAIFDQVLTWVNQTALEFMFKKYKAPTSLHKKYKVTKLAELKPDQVEMKEFHLTKHDLKVGSLKQDDIEFWVAVVNRAATDAGTLAVFMKEKGNRPLSIGIYEPWQVYDKINEEEIEGYIRDIRRSLRHEFVHLIQHVTEEGVGGKWEKKDDTKYWLRSHEYKPQLESAVGRFTHELYMIDRHKQKIERKHLLQFVGLTLNRPKFGGWLGDVTTDDLFYTLKKEDNVKWKRAIKDFIGLLKTDKDFHYKSLLHIDE